MRKTWVTDKYKVRVPNDPSLTLEQLGRRAIEIAQGRVKITCEGAKWRVFPSWGNWNYTAEQYQGPGGRPAVLVFSVYRYREKERDPTKKPTPKQLALLKAIAESPYKKLTTVYLAHNILGYDLKLARDGAHRNIERMVGNREGPGWVKQRTINKKQGVLGVYRQGEWFVMDKEKAKSIPPEHKGVQTYWSLTPQGWAVILDLDVDTPEGIVMDFVKEKGYLQ